VKLFTYPLALALVATAAHAKALPPDQQAEILAQAEPKFRGYCVKLRKSNESTQLGCSEAPELERRMAEAGFDAECVKTLTDQMKPNLDDELMINGTIEMDLELPGDKVDEIYKHHSCHNQRPTDNSQEI
jgi:hypothetical protein